MTDSQSKNQAAPKKVAIRVDSVKAETDATTELVRPLNSAESVERTRKHRYSRPHTKLGSWRGAFSGTKDF